MDVTKTPLYRALKPAIRKEDHGNLRDELQRVADGRVKGANFRRETLMSAFCWSWAPQGGHYWADLYGRLKRAGWSCA